MVEAVENSGFHLESCARSLVSWGSSRNCVAEEGSDATPVFNITNLLVPPVVDQNHYVYLAESVDFYTGTSN